MPVAVGSMYVAEKIAAEQAYKEMKELGIEDIELDLAGREEPAWGTHSWRRMGDRVARNTMAETGATELLISSLITAFLLSWSLAPLSQNCGRCNCAPLRTTCTHLHSLEIIIYQCGQG